METESSQTHVARLLEQNAALLKENNKILKKLHRYSVVGFTWKVFSFVLLIGLPFALYFYILEPYFTAMGSSYDVFRLGIQELPGLKGFEQMLSNFGASTTDSQ